MGLATAQLAGEDHLVGLDRLGADVAGHALVPVAGLGSRTAAGLARRISPQQWAAVESGMASVTARMLDRLPQRRQQALLQSVTIDLMGLHQPVGMRPASEVATINPHHLQTALTTLRGIAYAPAVTPPTGGTL